ncbi:hypothetical protein [Emcibacter sp. SYSU 3D8]|uniref:hypothetical protein n=1 Tax=Emcibacter sp. SYSU 3D8 TaxID=3133969 RepID=UPI0031FED0AD
MDPVLIMFGIRAAVRLGRSGAEIYAQRSRDRAVYMPDIMPPAPFSPYQLLIDFYGDPANLEKLKADPQLIVLWDEAAQRPVNKLPKTIEPLHAAFLAALTETSLGVGEESRFVRLELAGGALISQWSRSAEPLSPLGRIALTMADIALEFVGSNPSIIGAGGGGEKLIGAIASNLSALVPDDTDEFGPRAQFANHLVGIFLRAGLSALAAHPGLVFDGEHAEKLVTETLAPLIEATPDGLSERLEWQALLDALMGPAATAAFSVVAAKPDAFLGKKFGSDKALGALTGALFNTLKDPDLRRQFGDGGWITLYTSLLQVVADHPALFAGDGTRPRDELIRGLLSGAATTLQAHPGFDGPIGAELAAMAVQALNANAGGLLKLDRDDAWEGMALAMIGQVSGGLSQALTTEGGALRRFGHDQILELGRIFLVQAAATPGMIGVRRTELKAIVSGVASAMARDEDLLLSPDDWLKIAAVAAGEAAANPGRLFGLDDSAPGTALGALIIGDLLEAASAAWSTGRDGGSLLAGATLRDAIISALRTAADNAMAAASDDKPIKAVAEAINAIVVRTPDAFGSRDWLRLFEVLAVDAVNGGTVPELDEAKIMAILGKGSMA